MASLNRQQFQKMADKANQGGFSFDIHSGRPEAVTNSYMVGGQVPTTSVNAPATGAHVESFVNQNAANLQLPGRAVGAWLDSSRQPSAQVDIDVAQAHPRTGAGRTSARQETLDRDERAYGEVDEQGDYAGTHNNPFSAQAMSRQPGDVNYLSPKSASVRGEHFRSGINSSALARLLEGDRPGARRDWVMHDPSKS